MLDAKGEFNNSLVPRIIPKPSSFNIRHWEDFHVFWNWRQPTLGTVKAVNLYKIDFKSVMHLFSETLNLFGIHKIYISMYIGNTYKYAQDPYWNESRNIIFNKFWSSWFSQKYTAYNLDNYTIFLDISKTAPLSYRDISKPILHGSFLPDIHIAVFFFRPDRIFCSFVKKNLLLSARFKFGWPSLICLVNAKNLY